MADITKRLSWFFLLELKDPISVQREDPNLTHNKWPEYDRDGERIEVVVHGRKPNILKDSECELGDPSVALVHQPCGGVFRSESGGTVCDSCGEIIPVPARVQTIKDLFRHLALLMPHKKSAQSPV